MNKRVTLRYKGTLYGILRLKEDKISVQFSCSVMSTLCNPMDCSMPGLPVHHQLPKFTQTQIH